MIEKSSTDSRRSVLAVIFAVSLAVQLSSPVLARPTGASKGDVERFQRAFAGAIERGDMPQAADLVRDLAELDGQASARVLMAILTSGRPIGWRVVDTAVEGLRGLREPEARAYVIKRAQRGKAGERVIAFRVLKAYAPDTQAREALLAALRAREERVQSASLAALREYPGDHAGFERVLALMEASGPGRVASDARLVLVAWTGLQAIIDASDWRSWWQGNGESFDFEARSGGDDQADPGDDRSPRVRTVPESPLFGTVDSGQVVFVVDVSGSMQVEVGLKDSPSMSRLQFLKRELKSVINEQLTDGALFNIVIFSDAAKAWKKGLVRVNRKSRQSAGKFIDALKADGGTNTLGALKQGFTISGADTMVFLSDGTPTHGTSTDVDEILGQVRGWNAGRGLRVDTIAFLSGAGAAATAKGIVEFPELAKEFMSDLASQNGGKYRLVD